MAAQHILLVLVALLVYIYARQDVIFVPFADRPKPRVAKRQSINYYGHRGAFFVED